MFVLKASIFFQTIYIFLYFIHLQLLILLTLFLRILYSCFQITTSDCHSKPEFVTAYFSYAWFYPPPSAPNWASCHSTGVPTFKTHRWLELENPMKPPYTNSIISHEETLAQEVKFSISNFTVPHLWFYYFMLSHQLSYDINRFHIYNK